MKTLYIFTLFFLFSPIFFINNTQIFSDIKIVVYANYEYIGCIPCDPISRLFPDYFSRLNNSLYEIGITNIQLKYIDIEPGAYNELREIYQKLDVPEYIVMQGRIIVNINDKFLFINMIPIDFILDFLVNYTKDYEKIIIFKDEIRGLYVIIDENGLIKECETWRSFEEIKKIINIEKGSIASYSLFSILNLIIISGLLDSINPCAISVLLFFIAFIFLTSLTYDSLEKIRRRILLIGSIYIIGVYTAYLSVGLGFLRIIKMLPFLDLVEKISAIIVILLGFINIKDYFWKKKDFSLKMPMFGWNIIKKLLHKFTMLSIFIVGLLVSLFELPCTGGIYIAIIGLLAYRATFMGGLIYLIIYNIAFIFPLLLILFIASRKKIMEFSIEKWQERIGKHMRLLLGLIMIILGIFILFL